MDWIPRTRLGREVAQGSITLDEIFASGRKIKEPGIIDHLIPSLQNEIIFMGGSPGKGGGIRRTPTRRTVRMHRSGRRFRISALAVVGNGDGYIGIGKAVAMEHREAVNKAIENAKLSIFPLRRGCGSWECACGTAHTIPVHVVGKAGSVRVALWPAPKGIGLAAPDEAKKILRLAGIRDIWSKRFGESRTRLNYAYALIDALRKINSMKLGEAAGEAASKEGETEDEEIAAEEAAEAPEEGEAERPEKKKAKRKKPKAEEEAEEKTKQPENDAENEKAGKQDDTDATEVVEE